MHTTHSSSTPSADQTLHVIGLGPGDQACLTPMARQALQEAQCIAGYSLYLDLLPEDLLRGKKLISTGMRREEERCREAIAAALQGSSTALVCSGDPGVYALAGLVLEILEAEKQLEALNLTIVPGVPALCACAALLGAPLTHDFACISLSDLLTPWSLIEKRLHAAGMADFVLVIYNPRSRGRSQHLARAMDILKKYRSAECPVGLVRNAYRLGQSTTIFALSDFDVEQVDMLSLVIVGNSESYRAGRYMLTPRGYHLESGK
ncbi:MAG: precorrin-3B C(17)-methyltransferase [Desulfovibrio sp.]|nr:precorrin-3B C(17)-methyltransferase [Desulfovibrio sp.]